MADLKPGNRTKEKPDAKEWTWQEGEDFIHDAFRAKPVTVRDIESLKLGDKDWVNVDKRPPIGTEVRIKDQTGYIFYSDVRNDNYNYITDKDGKLLGENKKAYTVNGFKDGRVQIKKYKFRVLCGGKSGAAVMRISGNRILKIFPKRDSEDIFDGSIFYKKTLGNVVKKTLEIIVEENTQKYQRLQIELIKAHLLGNDSDIDALKKSIDTIRASLIPMTFEKYQQRSDQSKWNDERDRDSMITLVKLYLGYPSPCEDDTQLRYYEYKWIAAKFKGDRDAIKTTETYYKTRKWPLPDKLWEKAQKYKEWWENDEHKRMPFSWRYVDNNDKEKSKLYREAHGGEYDDKQKYFRSLRDILLSNTFSSNYRAQVYEFGFLNNATAFKGLSKDFTSPGIYPFQITEELTAGDGWTTLEKYVPNSKREQNDIKVFYNVTRTLRIFFQSLWAFISKEGKPALEGYAGCHRDAHPGNIFVNKNGQVKLIDFDLSLTNHPLITVQGSQCTRETLDGSWGQGTLKKLLGNINDSSRKYVGVGPTLKSKRWLRDDGYIRRDADLFQLYSYYEYWKRTHAHLQACMSSVRDYVKSREGLTVGQKKKTFLLALEYVLVWDNYVSKKVNITKQALEEYAEEKKIPCPNKQEGTTRAPKCVLPQFKIALKF